LYPSLSFNLFLQVPPPNFLPSFLPSFLQILVKEKKRKTSLMDSKVNMAALRAGA
jgi:hypothetical protein